MVELIQGDEEGSSEETNFRFFHCFGNLLRDLFLSLELVKVETQISSSGFKVLNNVPIIVASGFVKT